MPAKSISTQVGTVKGPDGVTYPSVHELLTAFGVTFPEGATAGLPIGGEGVAMRNTQANLDIGEVIATALIEADGGKLSDEELDLIRTQIEGLKPVGR